MWNVWWNGLLLYLLFMSFIYGSRFIHKHPWLLEIQVVCVSKRGTNQICEWIHGIIIWSQQNKDFRYVFAHDIWLTVYTFIENILKSLFATAYTSVNDSNSCLFDCDSFRLQKCLNAVGFICQMILMSNFE